MNRSLIMQVALGIGAVAAVGLILFFSYRSWKLVSADRELRREMEAASEYHDRMLRMQRWLMPYVRPLGWKRVPLNKPVDLPHIQNRSIKVHLHAPVDMSTPKRGWWRRNK
jgi:hypothetical protein